MRPTRLAVFDEFGFREHLTPQRSNGLRSMVERIRADAREALAAADLARIDESVQANRVHPGLVRGILRPKTSRYFRFRCCWPSPIFLASCERATA